MITLFVGILSKGKIEIVEMIKDAMMRICYQGILQCTKSLERSN